MRRESPFSLSRDSASCTAAVAGFVSTGGGGVFTSQATRKPRTPSRNVGTCLLRTQDLSSKEDCALKLQPRIMRSVPEEGPVGSCRGAVTYLESYQSAHHWLTLPIMSNSPHGFGFFSPTG